MKKTLFAFTFFLVALGFVIKPGSLDNDPPLLGIAIVLGVFGVLYGFHSLFKDKPKKVIKRDLRDNNKRQKLGNERRRR